VILDCFPPTLLLAMGRLHQCCAATLLLGTHSSDVCANQGSCDQTSLMQGMVARKTDGNIMAVAGQRNSMTDLMESATAMIKSGTTPDVLRFVNETLDEIRDDIFPAIISEHDISVNAITAAHKLLNDRIAVLVTDTATWNAHDLTVGGESTAHFVCRSEEGFQCAKTRKCQRELEWLWGEVVKWERKLREWHTTVYKEWCIATPVEPTLVAYPFDWDNQMTVTSYSYPILPPDQTQPLAGIALFRKETTEDFSEYTKYYKILEVAWGAYRQKDVLCGSWETTFSAKTQECDKLQTDLEASSCSTAAHSKASRRTFGSWWQHEVEAYLALVAETKQLVTDRIHEWQTLHIVTCLLGVIHDRVVSAIDDNVPCITEISDPTATTRDIDNCHQTNVNLTLHLHITYPPVPTPPTFPPPPTDPPCSPAYMAAHYTAFDNTLVTKYHASLDVLKLDFEERTDVVLVNGVWTAVVNSVNVGDMWQTQSYVSTTGSGWPGCAAPLVCTVCSALTPVTLPPSHPTTGHHTCHLDELSLVPGEMDSDTFRCLDGTCIAAGDRCNGVPVCGDDSDELSCTGCDGPAVISKPQPCNLPSETDFSSGSFAWKHLFECADQTCIAASGQCNGFANCVDGSEESMSTLRWGQQTSSCDCSEDVNIVVEATSGRAISTHKGICASDIVGSKVFLDRDYKFTDLGGFKDSLFIQTSNNDKDMEHDRVVMKVNIPEPLVFFVVTQDTCPALSGIPWLMDGTWVERTELDGPKYDGVHVTPWKEWKSGLSLPPSTIPAEGPFGPGRVFSRTFAAGTVSMPGNGGGDGSYLLFIEKACTRSSP